MKKKTTVRKAASRRPAGAKPARPSAARPAPRRPPSKPPRAASPAAGAAGLRRVVEQLEARLAGVERHFEEAKSSFEEASRVRSTELGHGRQTNKDLNAHATALRLLTVRRTELLWLKRLLEADAL